MRALTPALTAQTPLPRAAAPAAPRALAGLPRPRRMTAAGACWLLLCYVVLTAWDEHRTRLARARDARARRTTNPTNRHQSGPLRFSAPPRDDLPAEPQSRGESAGQPRSSSQPRSLQPIGGAR